MIISPSPPLSFVRSGVVDLYNGSSKYVGRDGYNWGSFSTAFDSIITAAAYFLDIPPSYVLPSHGPGNRWTGFPIRCHPTQHRVILIPLFFNHSPRTPTFNQPRIRVDARLIEAEVVRGSRSNRGKRHRKRRPVVTIEAEAPQRTVAQMDVSTTDEPSFY